MEKFIYISGEVNRDLMLSKGFELIKSDDVNKMYVFINSGDIKIDFAIDSNQLAFSNILTF